MIEDENFAPSLNEFYWENTKEAAEKALNEFKNIQVNNKIYNITHPLAIANENDINIFDILHRPGIVMQKLKDDNKISKNRKDKDIFHVKSEILNSNTKESYKNIIEKLINDSDDISPSEIEILNKIASIQNIDTYERPIQWETVADCEVDLYWINAKVLLFLNYNKDDYLKAKQLNLPYKIYLLDETFDIDEFLSEIKGE